MIYSTAPNPPAKFTASMYGKTVTIELDHSDFDLTELMEIFKGLTIASGFEINSWNNVIKALSAEIHDNETEDLKEKLNEWKDEDEDEFKDLRHNTDTKAGLDEWKARNGFGSPTGEGDVRKRYNKDSEGYESTDELDNDFFGPWGSVEEEIVNDRMDIIGQNGNEGTHYEYDGQFNDWKNETPIEEDEDTQLKDYKGIHITRPTYDWDSETNDILTNINDSITLIRDRMEDIDMRMDNIDEQLGVLNADVANIELDIAFPPPNEHILQAKGLYDRAVKASERDKERRNEYVDMETGEVSVDGEYSNNGGFDGKALFTPYKKKPNQKVTEKVIGKWQTDNKTKEVVKLDKTKVRKGKIKDLKK